MTFVAFDTLLAFAATCLVIEMTPGPNMAYLAVLSASRGRAAGYAATLGVGLGLLLVGLAAALGLAAIIASSSLLYEVLRWGGFVYLLWLAWETWSAVKETSPGKAGDGNDELKFFTRGLVTNLLNPKAGIFYVAVLPSFVDETRSLLPQTIGLSITFVLIASVVHATIVTLAGAARPWLEDPARTVLVRRMLAVLLAMIALWLFFATRR